MATFDIDVTDLLALADDLQAASETAVSKVRPVVSKEAVKIKATMRADMAASEHFGQAASSISYDLNDSRYAPEAQIGPRKGSPGSIANIAYFGGARGGGTVRDPLEAAEEEREPFEAALTAIITDLL